MGGGGRYPYPKWVYSPLGGWWENPRPEVLRQRQRVAGIFAIVSISLGFWYSTQIEHVARDPVNWVPSMLWNQELRERWEKRQLEQEERRKKEMSSAV